MISRQTIVGGAPPPPGIVPDFVHHDSTVRNSVIYCQAFCYSIVTCIVLIRLYTKFYITKSLEREDYACTLAWVVAMVFSALALGCIDVGGGIHQWNVPIQDVSKFLQIQYFNELLYYVAAFLTKTSILFLIARIFSPHEKTVLSTYIIIGLMLAYYFPMFFVKLFRCHPVHKYWDMKVEGNCIKGANIFVADGVTSVLSDVAILLLPMPLLWNLQLSTKRKLRLVAIFGGGTLACVVNIIRLVFNFTLDLEEDATYGVTIFMLLCIAEVNLGIICSCLPIIPIFVQQLLVPSNKRRTSNYSTHHVRLERLELAPPWTTTGTARSLYSEVDCLNIKLARAAFTRERPLGGKLEVCVLGGCGTCDNGERIWEGEGILRTVDIEQSEVEVPKQVHVEDPSGSTPR